MAEQEACSDDCIRGTCCGLLVAAVLAVIIFISVFVGTFKAPVYTVTITGVAGLDDPSMTSLAPVFNLTVRIDNARNRLDEACVERLSKVAVSYQDAPLGRGSVPQFCAKEGKVRERGVRAWGQGVALPPFLRDQLAGELAAGEASVDVTVTTPAERLRSGDTVLVCNGAKIGGGPARCQRETVYHQLQREEPDY